MSQNPWGEPPRPDETPSNPPPPQPAASGPEFVMGAPTGGASAPAGPAGPAQAPSGGPAPAYPAPSSGLYGPPGVYPPSSTGPASAYPASGTGSSGAYPPPGGAATGAYPPPGGAPTGAYPAAPGGATGAYPPAGAGSAGGYPPAGGPAPAGQPGPYPPGAAYPAAGGYPPAPPAPAGGYPPAPPAPAGGYGQPGASPPADGYGQPGSAYPPGGAPTTAAGSGGGYEPSGQAPVYPQSYGAAPSYSAYGQAPGYPQQYGYGASTGPRPPEIGDAVGWSWRRLWANPGPFLVMGALLVVPMIIFTVVLSVGLLASLDVTSPDYTYSSMGNPTSSFGAIFGLGAGYIFATLLFLVWSVLWQAFMLRGALKATVDQKVTLKDCFNTTNLGPVLLALFLMDIVQSALMQVPVLGSLAGLVLISLGMFFVPLLVLDQAMPLGQAIQTSWKTVFNKQNIGGLLLLGLIFALIASAGIIALGIGIIITIPLASLGQVYVYKRTLGLPVPA